MMKWLCCFQNKKQHKHKQHQVWTWNTIRLWGLGDSATTILGSGRVQTEICGLIHTLIRCLFRSDLWNHTVLIYNPERHWLLTAAEALHCHSWLPGTGPNELASILMKLPRLLLECDTCLPHGEQSSKKIGDIKICQLPNIFPSVSPPKDNAVQFIIIADGLKSCTQYP